MTTYVWFVRGDEHAAMCKTSIESVRKVDPASEIVVMTDDRELPNIGPQQNRYFNSHDMPIMVANVEAQCRALFIPGDGRFVFLDTDIILLKELPSVGELTVTWRTHVYMSDEGEKISGVAASMPYNYGVITAKFTRGTAEAFTWMRERIRKMHPQHQEWYGNQLALAELAGQRPVVGIFVEDRQIPWTVHAPSTHLTVGKIPCDRYNYTPGATGENLDGKFALHFKGKARPLMKDYALALGLGWYL